MEPNFASTITTLLIAGLVLVICLALFRLADRMESCELCGKEFSDHDVVNLTPVGRGLRFGFLVTCRRCHWMVARGLANHQTHSSTVLR